MIDITPSDHLTHLAIQFEKLFTSDGFGNWFRKRCGEAQLHHCSVYGLRKAGGTITAMNCATPHQLLAIFGWDSVKQAELYTLEANEVRLAGLSMHRLAAPSTALEVNGRETHPSHFSRG